MARIRTFILPALAAIACAVSAELVSADGIQDNIPENVRRIPELGVPVPEDRAASMRTSLGQLQEKIAAINAGKEGIIAAGAGAAEVAGRETRNEDPPRAVRARAPSEITTRGTELEQP